jgi:quercetin dioxygenase-like cupin family protein
MPWETVILQPGEGERRLFRIGLMTFKALSHQTAEQFAFIETELPPDASVERHQHPEAEMFYILAGQFRFWIADDEEGVECGPGAFLLVPPHVEHAFANAGDGPGRIFGMLTPARPDGLESLFRTLSVPVRTREDLPDLTQPVEHLQRLLAERRGTGDHG